MTCGAKLGKSTTLTKVLFLKSRSNGGPPEDAQALVVSTEKLEAEIASGQVRLEAARSKLNEVSGKADQPEEAQQANEEIYGTPLGGRGRLAAIRLLRVADGRVRQCGLAPASSSKHEI